MKIGSHVLTNNLVLAPMAGVTDKPFRRLCKEAGAGMLVSEMLSSDISLYNTRKSRQRLDHSGEASPVVAQIAGADPKMMAQAASFNVDHGADIIDINMGCPAKKVCRQAAGSALMQDEALVARILSAVVDSVEVPVTLKMRTGWDLQHRNAPTIARVAEDTGIQALTVHGRSRACAFRGIAEHETTALVKDSVSIPVIANGDICTPQDAERVLRLTSADGLMIGRAAQGNPWIFGQVDHYLNTGELLPAPSNSEIKRVLGKHLESLYDFYGEYLGVRIARKHIGWYCRDRDNAKAMLTLVNAAESCQEQLRAVSDFFEQSQNRKIAA